MKNTKSRQQNEGNNNENMYKMSRQKIGMFRVQ